LALRDDWNWDHGLLVDADGQLFVNYLKVIDADGIPGEVESGLSFHREIVETRLEQFADPGRIREEYCWAADYHHFVVTEFFGSSDYLITEMLSDSERVSSRQFRRLP